MQFRRSVCLHVLECMACEQQASAKHRGVPIMDVCRYILHTTQNGNGKYAPDETHKASCCMALVQLRNFVSDQFLEGHRMVDVGFVMLTDTLEDMSI